MSVLPFFSNSRIYEPDEIDLMIEDIRPYLKPTSTNRKLHYYNVPSAFDLESSSFFRSNGNGEREKVAIMYVWAFGIYGRVMIGRTWSQFVEVMESLPDLLGLNENLRLIIYVHNLEFDFQFFRKWLEFQKVFAIDNRKPIYAITTTNIEFRCSYLLTGYSLAKVGEHLQKYKVSKLVGDLNYDLIRHSETPLSDTEVGYVSNDVKVIMAHIMEEIEHLGNINRIPLTKTGYVREYCRNRCFYEKGISRKKSFKRLRYLERMKALQLNPDEYQQLKRAFMGGFTHCNPFHSGKTVENVTSFDFCSSYPFVMVSEMFPMSKGEEVAINSLEELEKNLSCYCCLFDISFTNIRPRIWYENYISESHCINVEKAVVNNGRIVSADYLETTITEQDYLIIKTFYEWDKARISNFRRYKKDYLPMDFVKAILKLYYDKTTLKGVEGKEVEYLSSKEKVNACYGMAVTDIVRMIYNYTDDWQVPETPELEKAISDYNNSKSRFLYYPWGVWVTAYARRNLFSGIVQFGSDYVYSDTDSIKATNAEKHMDYINKYNDSVIAMLNNAMDYHKIPHDMYKPKTVKGVEKPLGVWEYDGHYKRFKSLGAKRYLVQYSDDIRNGDKSGHYMLTVAGLNKKAALPYLLDKYGEQGIFEGFNDNLDVPPENTGKLTHTYIDDIREGQVMDYLGNVGTYCELSGVHLEKCGYSLTISEEYKRYIIGIEDIYK